jgi:hypothetical protein
MFARLIKSRLPEGRARMDRRHHGTGRGVDRIARMDTTGRHLMFTDTVSHDYFTH